MFSVPSTAQIPMGLFEWKGKPWVQEAQPVDKVSKLGKKWVVSVRIKVWSRWDKLESPSTKAVFPFVGPLFEKWQNLIPKLLHLKKSFTKVTSIIKWIKIRKSTTNLAWSYWIGDGADHTITHIYRGVPNYQKDSYLLLETKCKINWQLMNA